MRAGLIRPWLTHRLAVHPTDTESTKYPAATQLRVCCLAVLPATEARCNFVLSICARIIQRQAQQKRPFRDKAIALLGFNLEGVLLRKVIDTKREAILLKGSYDLLTCHEVLWGGGGEGVKYRKMKRWPNKVHRVFSLPFTCVLNQGWGLVTFNLVNSVRGFSLKFKY